MSEPVDTFYDSMASAYHLIFGDWEATIARQQAIISQLLPSPEDVGRVLDCACGIGTQILGLARAGYKVEGTDLSFAEIERAKAEAAARQLDIPFRVDDMRELRTSALGTFGAILAFDNALPHLDSDEDVRKALDAMRARLRPGGRLLISLRDYGPLMERRPTAMPPAMFWDERHRRIVHQVWDWKDDRRYTVHVYITRQMRNDEWRTNHFLGHYRAITPEEVARHAKDAGFRETQVLPPADTGYYQPIVTALLD